MNHIKGLSFLGALFFLGAAYAQNPALNIPLDIPAVEFAPRGGLPNFYAKLKASKDVKIGYFGGSITSQPGWRVHSLNYFKERFPKANISEIHAAIGGTTSELGAFRMQRDLLRHGPDLVFVEFAVNDGGTPAAQLVKSMEGIVRQIWRANPHTDICFVYTLTFRDLERLQSGLAMRSSAVMEYVAKHYGMPSVNMGVEVAKLEKEGKLVMRTEEMPPKAVAGDQLNESAEVFRNPDGKIPFSKDGVHPYVDTGHALYMISLKRAFEKLEQAPGKTVAHALISPIDPANWENTKAVGIEDALVKRSGKWEKLSFETYPARHFEGRADAVYKFSPGASLEFKFRGTKVMLYDLLGASCGVVEIELDGEKTKSARLDGYSDGHRLALLKIGDGLENKVHHVKITVLGEKPDKREILFERNRPAFDKKPEFFAPTNFYPVLIYIVGDMVK